MRRRFGSLAGGLEWIGHRRLRFDFDALLVIGPEHARLFREAGWDRSRVCQELLARSESPARDLARGAGEIAEGIEERFVADPAAPVPKFVSPEQILLAHASGDALLAHASGDAGLFSMVYGGWVAGGLGSDPVTRSIEPWL